jgi:hypothetical protein
MKTNLNRVIESEQDALEYLWELYDNGEAYHPEDDASDIVYRSTDIQPNEDEIEQLNSLMECVYMYIYDPCEILLKWINGDYKR